MKIIAPFRGLRPLTALAKAISAPPYDVINRTEAKILAAGNPHSFLHVSRAEINLPDEVSATDPSVYAMARNRLRAMIDAGWLVEDSQPCLYAYRLTMDGRQQLGWVGLASVAAYQSGRIKKHELTRPDKEEDRTRLAEALQAHAGPVFLLHRPDAGIRQATDAALAAAELLYDVTTDDGIGHTLWRVADVRATGDLEAAFERIPCLYIADGHHRSAAAVRVAETRAASTHPPAPESSVNRFLSVVFPADQLRIMDYNRVVRDLHGYTVDSFLQAISGHFIIHPAAQPVKPVAKHHFGLYLPTRGWFQLQLDPRFHPPADTPPRDCLDVALLDRYLLAPVLNIHDPRRDPRIDFVGGIRGMEGLMAHCDGNGMAAGFSLYPPDLEDLMRVADAGQIMPPKSTWFEPKLRDGLVIQSF
ncbi:MAG: DUF1015 domain-containing protein [Magnetococcales bacterium]|nr:DUF1015 domain-containing protein [Magnetococcales bacterium]